MAEIPITLESRDGKTVSVVFDQRILTETQAHDFAFDLVREAGRASNFPDWHQSHINLLASCPLCVFEAQGQPDRLTYEEVE